LITTKLNDEIHQPPTPQGYALTVLDARTGEPVALKDDLAGATGLAVLNKDLKTDAQGRFSLQEAASAVRSLVSGANALQSLTSAIAGLVSEVAKVGGSNPTAQAKLSGLVFVGTVLTGDFQNGAFRLTNTLNGAAVDAATGTLTTVTTQTTSSGGHSSSGPAIVGTPVGTADELFAALADSSVETIALTADITLTQPIAYHLLNTQAPYYVTIDRPVVINGYDHTLTAYSYTQINHPDVTIKNLKTNQGVLTPYGQVIGGVRIDNVTFNQADNGNAVIGTYYNTGVVINACTFNGGGEGVLFESGTVTNCTFTGLTDRSIRYKAPSTITGNTIQLVGGAHGIQFESSQLNSAEAIADVKNNTFTWDGTGETPYAYYFQQPFSNGEAIIGPKMFLLNPDNGNHYNSVPADFQVYAADGSNF
jgi:hypothetical protein